jgi:hypothetical protein
MWKHRVADRNEMLLSSHIWLYLRLASGMASSPHVSWLEFCVHVEKHSSHLLFYNEVFCEFTTEEFLKPCSYFVYVLILLYGNTSRMQGLRFLDEFRSLASLKLFVRQLLVNKFLDWKCQHRPSVCSSSSETFTRKAITFLSAVILIKSLMKAFRCDRSEDAASVSLQSVTVIYCVEGFFFEAHNPASTPSASSNRHSSVFK